MALSDPRTIFGIHQMTALNRTTFVPYGTIKVLASAEATREREQIDLYGGSNPNQWDSEDGNVSGDVVLNIKEFSPFLYTLAGYSTSTTSTPSTTGTVSSVTDKVGTSISADLTVAVETTADLKTGRYIVKATAADEVAVYAVLDTDFTRGEDESYDDDTLVIASGDQSTVDAAMDNFGLTLTGSWSFTTNDTAYFDVKAPYTEFSVHQYTENPTPVEFEMWLSSQKKANGEFIQHHFPRVKFASIPASLTEKAWTEGSVTVKVLYDSSAGYSHRITDITI